MPLCRPPPHVHIPVMALSRQMSLQKDLGVRPSRSCGDLKCLIGNERQVYPGLVPQEGGKSLRHALYCIDLVLITREKICMISFSIPFPLPLSRRRGSPLYTGRGHGLTKVQCGLHFVTDLGFKSPRLNEQTISVRLTPLSHTLSSGSGSAA